MLINAGFTDVAIQVKENAADFIKDWMPGSGAEKYITSAYVTAKKPFGKEIVRDNVRADCSTAMADVAAAAMMAAPQDVDAGC
mmetsp:Transcript_139206/g.242281  ORF Transcript_139206/g.242281 Transcript_139206/m.242281 type:complete len:83 (+) Transcript_139206:1038-1286(+)